MIPMFDSSTWKRLANAKVSVRLVNSAISTKGLRGVHLLA